MSRKNLFATAIAIVMASAGTPAFAGKDVTMKDLPAEVRQTVERETQGGKIEKIERETEKGQVVYEVEFTQGGKEWEIVVANDGKLLRRAED